MTTSVATAHHSQPGFSPDTKPIEDLEQIAEYSTRALAEAQKLPSLTDVKIGLSLSNPEVQGVVQRAIGRAAGGA